MMIKMKNRSHRHEIVLGLDNIKYKSCLSMMMPIYIKQHLSNIWKSVHEKVKQHWGWAEKSVAYFYKQRFFQLSLGTSNDPH